MVNIPIVEIFAIVAAAVGRAAVSLDVLAVIEGDHGFLSIWTRREPSACKINENANGNLSAVNDE